MVDKAKQDPTISEISLHVQVNNITAKNFYLNRGFEEIGVIKDYYKKIEPSDCFLLSMKLDRRNNVSTVVETEEALNANNDIGSDK